MDSVGRQSVALVTGAGRGIGAACAFRLAKDGFVVVMNDIRVGGEARVVLRELRAYQPESVVVRADVSKRVQVKRLFDFVDKKFGRIDVLVNNAGIASRASIDKLTEVEWDRTMAVNVKSVFLCSKAALRLMRKNRKKRSAARGKIIQIASAAGIGPSNMGVHYSASKAAVLGFSRTLANNVASLGILVNCVAPGPIDTYMLGSAQGRSRIRELSKKIPLGRVGAVEDVAGVVSFLAGRDADYITGEVIVVDGGMVMGQV